MLLPFTLLIVSEELGVLVEEDNGWRLSVLLGLVAGVGESVLGLLVPAFKAKLLDDCRSKIVFMEEGL